MPQSRYCPQWRPPKPVLTRAALVENHRPLAARADAHVERLGLPSGDVLAGCSRQVAERFGHRRDGQKAAVTCLHDLPTALMHEPVVAVAKQDQVLQLGTAAAGPVDKVMGVGGTWRSLAAGPDAVLVPGLKCPPPICPQLSTFRCIAERPRANSPQLSTFRCIAERPRRQL